MQEVGGEQTNKQKTHCDYPHFTDEKTEALKWLGLEPKQSGSMACACNQYIILSLIMPCIYTAICNNHSPLKKYLQHLEMREEQGPGRQVTNQKFSVCVGIHLSYRNNSSSMESIASH